MTQDQYRERAKELLKPHIDYQNYLCYDKAVEVVAGLLKENDALQVYQDAVEKEVGEVYCYITNNKLSKPAYLSGVIIAEIDDMVNSVVEEETKALQSQLDRIEKAASAVNIFRIIDKKVDEHNLVINIGQGKDIARTIHAKLQEAKEENGKTVKD